MVTFKEGNMNVLISSQPWAVQMEARAKWDAWNALKGTSKEKAMEEYIGKSSLGLKLGRIVVGGVV